MVARQVVRRCYPGPGATRSPSVPASPNADAISPRAAIEHQREIRFRALRKFPLNSRNVSSEQADSPLSRTCPRSTVSARPAAVGRTDGIPRDPHGALSNYARRRGGHAKRRTTQRPSSRYSAGYRERAGHAPAYIPRIQGRQSRRRRMSSPCDFATAAFIFPPNPLVRTQLRGAAPARIAWICLDLRGVRP